MDFMGIGLWELLFILLIALLVFGPHRLPEIARALGQGIRKFKMATTELTRELTAEMDHEIKEVKDEVQEAGEEVSVEVRNIGAGVERDVNIDSEPPPKSVEATKRGTVDASVEKKDEIEM